MPASHFLRPLLSLPPTQAAALAVDGSDALLAARLEAAVDSSARRRGLLGRDGLATGTALVIAPCSAVHTFGMRFPIDVIFAARDGRVLKIAAGLGPRRIAAALRAFAAIEMAAGEVERHHVKVGDYLKVVAAG